MHFYPAYVYGLLLYTDVFYTETYTGHLTCFVYQ